MLYGYCRVSTQHQRIDRQKNAIAKAYAGQEVKYFAEKYTGAKIDRPQFNRLLKQVKPGDTIIFDSVSRMSRTASEGMDLYEKLYEAGIDLVFLNEPSINTQVIRSSLEKDALPKIQTGDADADKVYNGIFDLLKEYSMALVKRQVKTAFDQAEKELLDTRERVKGGIASTKKNNEKILAKVAEGKLSRSEAEKDLKQIGHQTGTKIETKKAIRAKEKILANSKDFNGSLNDIDCIKVCEISRNTFYKYKSELLKGE